MSIIGKLGELKAAGSLAGLGALGAAGVAGAATVGGLSALALAGGPETPTPMSELAGPGALTRAEMMAGMTYEEKYGAWREEQLASLTVNQVIYGVDAEDAANKAADKIRRVVADRKVR